MNKNVCIHGKSLKENCLACDATNRADEKRLARFVRMREELEHAATDRHVLYRDHITTFEHGHSGAFLDCPAYECIKAREALSESRP